MNLNDRAFGRDSSHYTAFITDTNLKSLTFHTSKLTDGLHYYEDPTYKAQTDRAHSLGVPVLGSYHVLWGNKDLAGQADWWVQRVTALVPYWKTMPWIWQPDCESFGYNVVPTIAQINTFGDMVCARTGLPAERYLPYAPDWVYGSQLTALRYKNLWNSSYGANPKGAYRVVYPGDSSIRWSAAHIPTFVLQYGSNTDINDANAFRGTQAQFLAAIKATGTTISEDDMPKLLHVASTGGYYLTIGPMYWWLSTQPKLIAALKIWGLKTADAVEITIDDLVGAGVDVETLHGGDMTIPVGTSLKLGTTATVVG